MARALAIGLVVLGHAHQEAQEFGLYGVELFFALSGFLIGGILYRCIPEKGPWAFAALLNFWKRRWWRTLPAYYLFLVVAILHHAPRGELPEGGIAGLLPYLVFAPNLMSPNEVFFDVSWSLCVEEAFYLIFPLLLWGLLRCGVAKGAAFAIAILLLIVVAAALREFAFQSWPASQARVMTLPRLDAIAMGVVMAVWCGKGTCSRLSGWVGALVGGGIVVSLLAVHLQIRPLHDQRAFFRIALFLLPLGFALAMPLLARWARLAVRPQWAGRRIEALVTAVSLWSYSIYLCHHMVLLAVVSWFGEDREHLWEKLVPKALGMVLILLISRYVYRHYEAPMTRLRPAECGDGLADGASRRGLS